MNWYIEVLEAGVDTKQMMNFYKNSKKKINEMESEFTKQERQAKKKIKNLQTKLSVTQLYLKRLYDELVKPLFAEIKLKDEIIERHIKEEAKLNNDMKMLNSVIRIPRLCGEFQKALKKKRKAEIDRKEFLDAYDYLKPKIYEHGNNEAEFMETILTYIDTTYPCTEQNTIKQPQQIKPEILQVKE